MGRGINVFMQRRMDSNENQWNSRISLTKKKERFSYFQRGAWGKGDNRVESLRGKGMHIEKKGGAAFTPAGGGSRLLRRREKKGKRAHTLSLIKEQKKNFLVDWRVHYHHWEGTRTCSADLEGYDKANRPKELGEKTARGGKDSTSLNGKGTQKGKSPPEKSEWGSHAQKKRGG